MGELSLKVQIKLIIQGPSCATTLKKTKGVTNNLQNVRWKLVFRDVYFLICPPLPLSSRSSYCVWAVVSIYPARTIVELGRIHSNLIACHMKSFVFCHCGSTGDQYCQERVGHVSTREREISLNTCEEREALKDAAALLTSFILVRMRWGLCAHMQSCLCTLWHSASQRSQVQG